MGGKKLTTQEFINRSISIHGLKYDYSKSVYIHPKTKIIIICPTHGEFEQLPYGHLNGSECPSCARLKVGKSISESLKKKWTTEIFISKAKDIHGDLYDYSKVNYINAHEPVTIICKIHGEFQQTSVCHINNKAGCKLCSIERQKRSKEKFLDQAFDIHGDLYDYSLVYSFLSNVDIKVICKIHGIFETTINNHIFRKSGCPKCATEITSEKRKWSTELFISKAQEIHGTKYDYSLVDYTGSTNKIKIICLDHGIFEQTPMNHIHSEQNCPKCGKHISKNQKQIFNFINNYNNSSILEDHQSFNPYRLDIAVPDKNLVVEYNGVYWHSLNQGMRDLNHLNIKRLGLEKLGLRVINIYEDEWINSRPQIEQIIKNALGVISNKIFARKCSIWKCSYIDINFQSHIIPFFNSYHHQGLKYNPESIAYCLVYDNQIVACALFGSNKYHNQNECELIRYATIPDTKISGGLSKLISAFHKDYPQFKSIISFCDNRFFTGKSYEKIGFKKITDGEIGFNVIIKDGTKLIRNHRSIITKSKLSKYFSENELEKYSQKELAMSLGWLIIPDCGHSKLILNF